jgi:hypothetical protein
VRCAVRASKQAREGLTERDALPLARCGFAVLHVGGGGNGRKEQGHGRKESSVGFEASRGTYNVPLARAWIR